jgi:hypothetical protein
LVNEEDDVGYRVDELSRLIEAVHTEASQLEAELTAFPEWQRPAYAQVLRTYHDYVTPSLDNSQWLAYLLSDEDSVVGMTPDMRQKLHAYRDQQAQQLQKMLELLRTARKAGRAGHDAEVMKDFNDRAEQLRGIWWPGT